MATLQEERALTPELPHMTDAYSPVNIRQLNNILEQAKVLAKDGQITMIDLPYELRQLNSLIHSAPPQVRRYLWTVL